MIKIIEKNIDELVPYENNARINDKAVEAVANSISDFGFKNPVIIDKNNVLVAGHTRVKAAKKLGLTKVPCIIADDLDEDQIKAFRIADNSSAQLADWDYEKLMAELQDIDFDMAKYGLAEQMEQIAETIANSEEAEEDNFDCTPPEEPKSKPGDIYQLGEHRLMCGDSTKEEDVSKLMNGELADLIVTDPPYNVAIVGGSHALSPEERLKRGGLTIKNDQMDSDEFLSFLSKAFKQFERNLKRGGGVLCLVCKC